jgi:heat-inducible transcriptional repressor
MGAAKNPQLPSRAVEILHSIIRTYIESGEPVASRTISRRWARGQLSPASIRNIMADLSEEGFLEQPHTSAGRVPTEKAFRVYAQSLTGRPVPAADVERLRTEIGGAETVEDRMERSSHLLTEMTRNVGIAAAIPTAAQVLDQVELLPLADRRVLMIVVTRDRVVRNKVVALDEPMPQDELVSIRNYINRNFSGWDLGAIQIEIRRRLAEERAAYDQNFRKLLLLCDQGLLNPGLTPELHMEGASNLVGLELHLTREKMRELFHALEEKKRILEILEQFLHGPSDHVTVRVGLGEVHPSMGELTFIGLSVPAPGGFTARIAVLGPMRMNYSKAISAVVQVGRVFGSLPV